MNFKNEHDNTSNYSKYMKYKKKYLELKNKKLQIGGVPLSPVVSVVIDATSLANLKQKADDFIIKHSMISDETITPCEPSQPQTESGETGTILQPPDKIIIKYNEREGVYNNRIGIVDKIIYEIDNLIKIKNQDELKQFSVEINEIINMLTTLNEIKTTYKSTIQSIKNNRETCKQIIESIQTTMTTNV